MRKTAIALSLLGLFACATPPPKQELTREEITRRENALAVRLMERVTSRLRSVEDIEVAVFVRSVAEKIAKASDKTEGTPLAVAIVHDQDSRWSSYGVPGNRLYLSLGLVLVIDYENTLAALIALELAHLGNRHLARREALSEDLTLTTPELAASVRDATEAMYRAGYDPRGMEDLLRVCSEHPQVGLGSKTLDTMRTEARSVIISLPPLRNPVIRTADFLRFKKRLSGRS